MSLNHKHLNILVTDALAMEEQEAKEAGALAYMARSLVQSTLPHSKLNENEFRRSNGAFNLVMIANSEIGLPYGSIPRLLIAWITTEAVKKKSRELVLGRYLSSFMEEIDLIPTGGRWGSITRLKDQMRRFFSCSISCTYEDNEHWAIKNVSLISSADLWWNPKSPDQATLFESTLTLNEDFFKEIITSPIPIDMRILKALKKSPLAIDIYCWLTYRMSYLKKTTSIPWAALQFQFGSNYSIDPQGIRNFKKAFLRELKKILIFYPQLNLEPIESGLNLFPSKTHINR